MDDDPPPPASSICGTLSCHTGHGIMKAPDDNPLSVRTNRRMSWMTGQCTSQDLPRKRYGGAVIRTRSKRVPILAVKSGNKRAGCREIS